MLQRKAVEKMNSWLGDSRWCVATMGATVPAAGVAGSLHEYMVHVIPYTYGAVTDTAVASPHTPQSPLDSHTFSSNV